MKSLYWISTSEMTSDAAMNLVEKSLGKGMLMIPPGKDNMCAKCGVKAGTEVTAVRFPYIDFEVARAITRQMLGLQYVDEDDDYEISQEEEDAGLDEQPYISVTEVEWRCSKCHEGLEGECHEDLAECDAWDCTLEWILECSEKPGVRFNENMIDAVRQILLAHPKNEIRD